MATDDGSIDDCCSISATVATLVAPGAGGDELQQRQLHRIDRLIDRYWSEWMHVKLKVKFLNVYHDISSTSSLSSTSRRRADSSRPAGDTADQ